MHTSMSPSGKYVPNGTEPNAETTMVFFFSFTPSPSNSFSKHSRINDSIFRNTIRRLFSDCFDGRSEAINSSVNASNNGEEEETPRARFFFFFFSQESSFPSRETRSRRWFCQSLRLFLFLLLLFLLRRAPFLLFVVFDARIVVVRSARRNHIQSAFVVLVFFSRLPSSRSSPLESSWWCWYSRSKTRSRVRRTTVIVGLTCSAMCAQTRAVLAGDARTTFLSDKKKKKKVGETNFQSLSLSLFSRSFLSHSLASSSSLVAVSRLRLCE